MRHKVLRINSFTIHGLQKDSNYVVMYRVLTKNSKSIWSHPLGPINSSN